MSWNIILLSIKCQQRRRETACMEMDVYCNISLLPLLPLLLPNGKLQDNTSHSFGPPKRVRVDYS